MIDDYDDRIDDEDDDDDYGLNDHLKEHPDNFTLCPIKTKTYGLFG